MNPLGSPLITNCAETGYNGADSSSPLFVTGNPDGIARRVNDPAGSDPDLAFISSRDSSGGVYVCEINTSGTLDDVLVNCSLFTISTGQGPVFDIHYDPETELLWGTHEQASNQWSVFSCTTTSVGIGACQEGLASGVASTTTNKAITSGRGNVFWTSDPDQTNTGIVASGQVSSYQSLTVAGTGVSDEITFYPSVYQP
jgi:hypothetical protein